MKKTHLPLQHDEAAEETNTQVAPAASPQDEEDFAGLWLFGLLADIFDGQSEGKQEWEDPPHTPAA